MQSERRSIFIYRVFIYILIAFIGFITVFPFYIVVTNSLKSNEEFMFDPIGVPQSIFFDNYIKVFSKTNIGINFLTTILLSVLSTILVLLFSVPAAFAIAKFKIRIRKIKINTFLYFFFILGFLVPAFIAITPLLTMFIKLNLLGNVFAVLLIYVAWGLPFTIFVMTGFFKQIPNELIEASRIDGCSNFSILTRIVLPLSKASLGAVAIIQMIWVWNDFLLPLVFLQGTKFKTLTQGTYIFRNRYTIDWAPIFAYSMVQIAPMLILYLFLQRYFISGIMAGAVKG